MLKKSTALAWLALCFVHCVLGVGATLTYRFLQAWWCSSLARWFLSLLWFFVRNSRTIFGSVVDMVQERGHMLALLFFMYHNWVWQKLITVKCFIAMWLCPSFCGRNHTIWHMPRVWHQPSQVGKAYDWFQCWNYLGSSETVSVHPGVTVATLCWGFGTQQSMIFCCLITFCHNCGDSLPYQLGEGEVVNYLIEKYGDVLTSILN